MDLNIPIPDEIVNDVLSIPMPGVKIKRNTAESQLLNIPIPDMPPAPVCPVVVETDKKEIEKQKSDFIPTRTHIIEIDPPETDKVSYDWAASGSPGPAKPAVLGADAARRRLQAFSIQKKSNALPPIINNSSPPKPAPTTASVSSPVLIGKKIQGAIKMVSAFHKPVLDVFSEADEKKRRSLTRPQTKKGLNEYEKSRLKLRNMESKKESEMLLKTQTLALFKMGVPLAMPPFITPCKPLPMPSKSMPPLKKMLEPEIVESLINRVKKGETSPYTFPKSVDKEKSTDRYRRDRSRQERDNLRKSPRRHDSKYRHDSNSSSDKKDTSKETDVNMEDFVVCDSWSMDTDPSIKEDSSDENLCEEVREKITIKETATEEELCETIQDHGIKDIISFSGDIKETLSPHSSVQQKLTNLEFLKTSFRSDTFKSVTEENKPQSPDIKPVDVSANMVYLSGIAAYTSIISEIYSPSSHESENEGTKSDRSIIPKLLTDVNLTPKHTQNSDTVKSLKKESRKENIFYSPGMVSSRESTPIVLPIAKCGDLKDVSSDTVATDSKSKEQIISKPEQSNHSKQNIDEVWKDVVDICGPKRHTDKNCFRETNLKPVIKYAENLRYCNCPGSRTKNFEKIAPTLDEITSQEPSDHERPSDSQAALTREWYPTVNYALSDKSNIQLSTNWETDDSLSLHETNQSATPITKPLSSLTADNLAKFDSVNKPDTTDIADVCPTNRSLTPTDLINKFIPNTADVRSIPVPAAVAPNLTSLDSEYEKFMEAVWPEVLEETNDNLKNRLSSKDNNSKTTGSTISKNLEVSSNSGSFKEFFESGSIKSKLILPKQDRSDSVTKNVICNSNELSEKDNSQDTCYGMDSASVVNGGSEISNKGNKVVAAAEKLTEKRDDSTSLEWKKMGSDGWSGESESEVLNENKSTEKTSTPPSLERDKKRKGHAKVSSRQRKTKTIGTKKERRQSTTTTSSDPDIEKSQSPSKRSSKTSTSSSETGTSSSSSGSASSSSSSSSSDRSTSTSDNSSESSDSSYNKKKKKRTHSKKKKTRKALLKSKKMKKKLAAKAKKLKIKKKKLKLLAKKKKKQDESEESVNQKVIMVKLKKSIAKSEKWIQKGKEKEKKKQQKRKLERKKNREASRKKKKRHSKKSENESSSSSSNSSSSSDTENESGLTTENPKKRKSSAEREGSKKKRRHLNSTDSNEDIDDMNVSFDMETVRNIKRERISDEEVETAPPTEKQEFSPRLKRTSPHQIISVNELHSDFIESNRKNEDLESQNTTIVKIEPELTKSVNVPKQSITEPENIPVPSRDEKLSPEINEDSTNVSLSAEEEEEESSSSSSSEDSSSDSESAKEESVDMFHDDPIPDDSSATNHSPAVSEDIFEKIPDEIEDIVRLRKPLGKLTRVKVDVFFADKLIKEREALESDETAAAEELRKQFDMVENYSTPVKRQAKLRVPCDVRPIPSLSAAVPVPQENAASMSGEIKWDWRPQVYPVNNEPKPRKASRWGVRVKADDVPITASSTSALIEVQLKSEKEIHFPSNKTDNVSSPTVSSANKRKSTDRHRTIKPQMIPGLESSYENNDGQYDENRVYQIQTISTVGSVGSAGEEFAEDRLEAYDEDDYEMMSAEGFEEPKNEDERKVALERRRHFQNQAKTISLDDRISMVLQRPPGSKLTNGDANPTEQTESVENEPPVDVVETSPEKGILIVAGIRITRADPRVLKVKRVCFADGLAPGQDSDCEENIQPPPPKKPKMTPEQRKLRKKLGGHAYPCPADWADYHPHWDTLPPPPPPPGSPPPHLYSKPCNIASLAGISEHSEGHITRLPRIPSHNETAIA